jgi:hypothetical protein
VLASLPALGEAGARALIQRRESGERFIAHSDLRVGPRAAMPSTSSDVDGDMTGAPVATAAPTARLDAVMMPSRLLIVSRGWQVGHPLTHEIQAVYALAGTGLRLQSVEERDR